LVTRVDPATRIVLSTAPSLPLAIDAAFRGEQSMVSFTITPLTDHTGAEVIWLDFTQPIDIETRATLSRAFAGAGCCLLVV
jgi:hypothetical protein